MTRMLIVLTTATLLLAATGCREEGPAEKAGRQIDEAVEKMTEGGEGTMERMGRELDEAAEETEEAADEMADAMKDAAN